MTNAQAPTTPKTTPAPRPAPGQAKPPATSSTPAKTPPAQASSAAPATEAKPQTSQAPRATIAVDFVTPDGWPMTLTLPAGSGKAAIEAALVDAMTAAKALTAQGAKPPAQVAPIASQAAPAGETEAAPLCAIHKKPMTRVQGSKGAFWSCHEKLEDGSFCPYRPAKK